MKYYKLSAYGLTGALAGYALYYFIGCNNGCALTGNPFISTGYGLAIGILSGWPQREKSAGIEKNV